MTYLVIGKGKGGGGEEGGRWCVKEKRITWRWGRWSTRGLLWLRLAHAASGVETDCPLPNESRDRRHSLCIDLADTVETSILISLIGYKYIPLHTVLWFHSEEPVWGPKSSAASIELRKVPDLEFDCAIPKFKFEKFRHHPASLEYTTLPLGSRMKATILTYTHDPKNCSWFIFD